MIALLLAARLLTLQEALETAKKNQPLVIQARASAEAAAARADQARSTLLPQVSGQATFERTTANFTPRPGTTPKSLAAGAATGGSNFDTFNYFTDSLTASQLLFDFGQAPNRYRASNALAEAARKNEINEEEVIALDVRSAYFTARANRALVGVAQETLENQRQHFEQVQGFVEVGTRAQIDLAQARTNVANAQVQLISARNNYDIARVQLNQTMGVEGPIDYDVSDQAPAPIAGEDTPDPGISALVDQALSGRPDVQALNDQIRSGQLTVSSLRGGYLPTINAAANFNQSRAQFTDWSWNASLGVTLTWNIFQGGFTTAQVREAEANVAGARAQLATLRQQALLSVRAAKATLEASRTAEASAREQFALAQGRYQAGAGSQLELNDAQLQLTNAQAQVVQSDQRLGTARAQLVKALGRNE